MTLSAHRWLLASAALLSSIAAQTNWVLKPRSGPPPTEPYRADDPSSLAYDEARGRMVFVGPDETWERVGTRWIGRGPATSLPPWSSAAYHTRRQQVVAFCSGRLCAWDGAAWTPVSTPGPAPRSGAALAYDRGRDRVVLVGIVDQGGSVATETWEWDGVQWTFASALSPFGGPRAIAYDEARGAVIVLAGPMGTARTWAWDGASWTERTPAQSPPWRTNTSLSYDPLRQRVLAFGGDEGDLLSGRLTRDDLWEWDGATWTQVGLAARPPSRAGAATSYDPARCRLVAFGGWHFGFASRPLTDTWEWDGTGWSEQSSAPWTDGHPTPPADNAIAYDAARGQVVLWQGDGRTWEWDGQVWRPTPPLRTPPGPRQGFALAPDCNGIVLFGGTLGGVAQDDTWTWDGTRWTEHVSPLKPTARANHAMAYDAARQRLVLFGGVSSGGATDDTWEWDGSSWLQRAPANRPPRLAGHAMAYDAARRRVVLFGAGTWLWDGSSWSQATPAIAPPPRTSGAMAFDARRDVVVLYGGQQYSSALDDTWEWDGSGWQQRLTPTRPPLLFDHSMVDDVARDQLLLYGGQQSDPFVGTRPHFDLWAFGSFSAAAAFEYGTPCTGPLPGPRLMALGTPVLGDRSFAVDLVGATPRAPAALVLGARRGSLPLGGCTLLVDPVPGLAILGLNTGITGFASYRMPVPARKALLGRSVASQVVTLDRTGAAFATSNGLEFVLGQ
ncbi:MAG: kelch repeat-containing protein [Planctomycetota bacterium]